MTTLRTRFAPSPSGYLHLGAARTALFNWALARRHGGQFVLRVEDTDRERSTTESEESLLEALRWLGINWDEGPVRQSERAERYAEVIEQLLQGGHAYRCVCTREALDDRRQQTIDRGEKWTYDGLCRDRDYGPECGEHTVRLRLPESGPLDWIDLVFGPSGQDAREIGDRIIRRADGSALYHLAVVVDDLDMRITHIVRGADHMPNTPFHVALYRALDAELPHFAHVPLILAESGKKLSKRRDPVSIQMFRDQGYLPDALRNWIIRTGWSHGDQEVFSPDEITQLFTLDDVGRAGARADADKLTWLNHHYIQSMPREELLEHVGPFLEQAVGGTFEPSEALAELVDLNRNRGKTLAELAGHCRWLITEPLVFDEKAARKQLKPATAELLRTLTSRLSPLEAWDEASLAPVFEGLCKDRDLKMGKLAQPVRVALTGGTVSPGIYDTLRVIGRPLCLARLETAARWAEENSGD